MNYIRIKNQIADCYDTDYLVDVLKITSRELVDRFPDKILDNIEVFEYVIDRVSYGKLKSMKDEKAR